MTIHVKNGSVATSISRRGFVAGSAGLTFAFTLGGLGRGAAIGETKPTEFNAWVSIAPDDTVTIICPSAEMGQGVLTSLPLVLAEELDADWSKVRAEFAPANPSLYGNPQAHSSTGRRSPPAAPRFPGTFSGCETPARKRAACRSRQCLRHGGRFQPPSLRRRTAS